jgi:hypothetical protein
MTTRVVDGTNSPGAISCPSASLCVATDGGGVVSSTDPTGGASAWRVTALDFDVGLQAISCPSTSLCVAADGAGNVIATTHPAGAASSWALTHPGPARLIGMSCPSPTLCVSTDGTNNIVLSTEPAGGASSWSEVPLNLVYSGEVPPDAPKLYLVHVQCPLTVLCFAFDDSSNVYTSTGPTRGASAWRLTASSEDTGYLAAEIACPSVSLCVALGVGDSGSYEELDFSTRPTTGSWGYNHVDSTNDLDAISCPSTNLCVAVDTAGDVVTTTDPTGAASSWTISHVDPHGLVAISCPSTALCVAVDNAGDVVTTTDPTGGSASWTIRHVDGPRALVAISCPSTKLCVAVDSAGYVIHGTAPATTTRT